VDKVDRGTGETLPGSRADEPLSKGRPYKRKTRNRSSVRRESEGVTVPSMAAYENAVGGKDPYFVRAFGAGKRG
jgi:hypothetical protein